MLITKPTIRFAQDSDSPAVQRLLEDNGFLIEGLDWSHIEPYWLVAEHRGNIVGCIQVLPGKPLGHLEAWMVDPDYHSSGTGIALLEMAEHVLAAHGSDGFTAHTGSEVVLKNLSRWRTMDLGTAHIIVKRIYRSKEQDIHGRTEN